MAFYGAEAMGIAAKTLSTHVICAAWSWGAYMGDEALTKGIRVKTSSFARHHVNITMCKAKANGNYMNSILAHQEAAQDGYDEALLLDVDGFVAEGSGENIFIVRHGKLYTPDLTSALEGITRDTIVQLTKEIGLEVVEKRITAMKFMLRMKPFLPAPRPKSRQFASWITAPLVVVRVARLPKNCKHVF